jgi:branched-chain amino acid transport system ATP-binding protein/urea transport system ATP-binding protein
MPETQTAAPHLRLAAVVAGYGEGTELHGVDLEVHPGERVGLLGRNGAGKTTLLRTVMGLTRVDAGTITFASRDLRRLPTFAVARLGLAYVPQGRELFGDFTVAQNLLTGLLGLPARGERDLGPALQAFPWLASRLGDRAGALSGGQQQQLAIGRAIVSRPALLMLDEPLEGVQPSVVEEIVRALSALCETTGMGLLLVEQNVEVVLRLCTRVVFIDSGVVRESHGSETLRGDPGRIERYLGI